MNEISTVPWIATLGIVAVIIIIGNFLFLFVFFKSDRIRRMRTSLLLINLTAADLIVGTVAIPMYMAVLWPGSEAANSKALRRSYDVIDVVSGFASLFGLAVIALERVYSVFWPHKHRSLSKAPYCVAVFLSWFVAALQLILKSLEWNNVITLMAFFHCIFFLLTAVVILILASYFTVWRKIKKKLNNSPHERRVHQERKLVKTLAIVTCIFLITWLPFHVVNTIFHLCTPCGDKLSLYLVYAAKLLHYSNSFANPVVYSFRFPEVRRALVKMCCGGKCRAYEVPHSINRVDEGDGVEMQAWSPTISLKTTPRDTETDETFT